MRYALNNKGAAMKSRVVMYWTWRVRHSSTEKSAIQNLRRLTAMRSQCGASMRPSVTLLLGIEEAA